MAQRTKYAWILKHYTDQGWEIDVVERTYSIGGKAVTFDLFGFGDLYGYRGKLHIIVQATTDAHHGAHVTALLANPRVEKYLRARNGNCVEAISECTRAKSKKGQVRVTAILRSDFD